MIEWRLYVYRLVSVFIPEMHFNRLKVNLLKWCGVQFTSGGGGGGGGVFALPAVFQEVEIW